MNAVLSVSWKFLMPSLKASTPQTSAIALAILLGSTGPGLIKKASSKVNARQLFEQTRT
jgi:hypothetical protein